MDEKLKAPIRLVVVFAVVYAYHGLVTMFLSGLSALVLVIAFSIVTWLLLARVVFRPVDQ